MVHIFSSFGEHSKEHRLILFAGGMANVPMPGAESLNRKDYLEWKRDTPGADALFLHFDEKTDVTIVDLVQYIDTLKALPPQLHTLFADELLDAKNKMDAGSTPTEKVEGEQKLLHVVELINRRNEVLEKSQMTRVKLNEGEILPQYTGQILELGKNVLGTSISAFKSATGQEKVLMLAGVATGLMLVRFGMRTMSDIFPNGSSALKKILGVSIGAGVTVMAFESLNKAIVKTTGHTLLEAYDRRNKTPQQLEDMDKQKALDKAYDEIAGQRISLKFINNLVIPEDNKKYILGIDRLSDLSVQEFLQLYDNNKAYGKIPDNDDIYGLTSKEDLLTPVKRFLLLEEIGQTLGLIDAQKNSVLPTKPLELEQPIMRRIIDEPKFLD